MNDYFLGKCSLIVCDDQFWGISTPFLGVNDHYLGSVITLGSTDRVFGILLQIHKKNLGMGQTPHPFGNARIFKAPITASGENLFKISCRAITIN